MSGSSPDSLVVVGASLAGLRAVEAARAAGFDAPITLIGAEQHLPYDRPPLSKSFLESADAEPTWFCEEKHLADELDVTLKLATPASALDTGAREVQVGDERIPYGALIIATGGHAREMPNPDALTGIYTLRNLQDALAIRERLIGGADVVVIGAGFIGSEVAASAIKAGARVTIVEAAPEPLARAVGAMGGAVARLHERNGVSLLCGVGVEGFEGRAGAVGAVVLADGRRLPADLVVAGIGMVPAADWLDGSGVTVDDGVVCDEKLFTGVPGVYAAGDIANWPNPMFGMRQRMENWTAAAEQGAAAARNAVAPENAKPYQTVPYFWSDWYDSRIQFVGVADPVDEIVVVDGRPGDSARWTALYRSGERMVGALTLNGQADIMKYRAHIMRGGDWTAAIELAEQRRARRMAKAG